MISKNEIQIFVSCPGDVNYYKEAIKVICKSFSDTNNELFFTVKDWKDIVGEYGTRPQEQINEAVGSYDIYIGILWRRFGTPPGAVNSVTGEEIGSGTEEEFLIALENWNGFKKPDIHLFFRTDKREVNDLNALEQLGKVLKFQDEQRRSNLNFLNEFDCELTFNGKIIKLLNAKQNSIIRENGIQEKKVILHENPSLELQSYKQKIDFLPSEYIQRHIIHYTSVQNHLRSPLLKTTYETLETIILTKKRVIVLGDAGSGKSSELKNLSHLLSQADSPFLSIFQPLNLYTANNSLENYLPEYWVKIPQDLLVIIWDGLDEIQPQNYNDVIRQITSFAAKYPNIRLVVSCRTNFYELPTSSSPGTLTGFEPYYMADMNVNEASLYYSNKFDANETKAFIDEVFAEELDDLITKPFFLVVLADLFRNEKKLSLSRSKLYESFVQSRIKLDEVHYKGTYDVRMKKNEITALLEKIAMSMEILGKNIIQESDLLQIINSQEFLTVKFCTAFKKADGTDDLWRFEHNNIQEYLAANALSRLPYETIQQFIAFEPYYKRIIPSWVNTLTFLISILEKDSVQFKSLMTWILENENELIVKFEREKLSEAVRSEIFQNIFNDYKQRDIWIRSNKFSDRELAYFAQSDASVQFLINQLKDSDTTRVSKVNAINLIGHFELSDNLKANVKDLLFELIDANLNDVYFVYPVIQALKHASITDNDSVAVLMEKLGESKNQSIRSAIYSFLLSSNEYQNYTDYLLEGYALINQENHPEREDSTLFDEEWNLKECLKKEQTADGVKKIIEFSSKESYYKVNYLAEVIESTIQNAIRIFPENKEIYTHILNWLASEIKSWNNEKLAVIISFFDKTLTRNKAFIEVWNSVGDMEREKGIMLAQLFQPELSDFIIEEYNQRNIKNSELSGFLHGLQWVRNLNLEHLENLIQTKTSFKIEKPPIVDYTLIRKQRLQSDFALLFDLESFKNKTLDIFEKENKTELSQAELFNLRKESNRTVDLEDLYSGSALRLLRDFTRDHSNLPVKKEEVIAWFNDSKRVEYYRMALIYQYLSNNEDLTTSKSEEECLSNWTINKAAETDFKTALTVEGETTTKFNRDAIKVAYYAKRFNVALNDEKLLEMLSFYNPHDPNGLLDFVKNKISDSNAIKSQMLTNLKMGIKDHTILENHVEYLTKNKVQESYPIILQLITNTQKTDRLRGTLLKIYIQEVDDKEKLKLLLSEADNVIRWMLVDHFVKDGDNKFLVEYLMKFLKNESDIDIQLKAASRLIRLQNVEGLTFYFNWLKSNKPTLDRHLLRSISTLSNKDAIPLLMEMLHFSYQEELEVEERFDSLNSTIKSALHNIAIFNEENFLIIKKTLETFIIENKLKYKDVNLLEYSLERMEDQFYMNKAKSYTISQAVEKLKQVTSIIAL